MEATWKSYNKIIHVSGGFHFENGVIWKHVSNQRFMSCLFSRVTLVQTLDAHQRPGSFPFAFEVFRYSRLALLTVSTGLRGGSTGAIPAGSHSHPAVSCSGGQRICNHQNLMKEELEITPNLHYHFEEELFLLSTIFLDAVWCNGSAGVLSLCLDDVKPCSWTRRLSSSVHLWQGNFFKT